MVDRSAELEARRARGAFFTPPAIADYLADWSVANDPAAKVLDPTCGEAVFLLSAARRLRALGCEPDQLDEQVYGIDLHQESLDESMALLEVEGLDGHLIASDVFDIPSPDNLLGGLVPYVDAVIGNPPFVRYQEYDRKKSSKAALAQGVRLSGLASSWAAVLVHSCSFLKPDGRLAMVLPAELITVNYAEPVRRWLRERFEVVHLVLFERLQFEDALENVVLVVAKGSGGCDAFSLHHVYDAEDLATIHAFDSVSVAPADAGKWTEMLIPGRQRHLFRKVESDHFVSLDSYGQPELGTVTGANKYFAITEETRIEYGLDEDVHVIPVCPPGTKHLKGLAFSRADWRRLRDEGERVWLLRPDPRACDEGLMRYVRYGEQEGVHEAYKCQVRTPWWRPPAVSPPDLFFTYMSHRYPRLLTNSAGTTFVNSMHGLRLRPGTPKAAKTALPLLMLNSVTMLGAELRGRSYGGGILKMEPREAASLPVPKPEALDAAWTVLKNEKASLDRQLRDGRWTNVAKRVDEVLLIDACGLGGTAVADLHAAARTLRNRRLRESTDD